MKRVKKIISLFLISLTLSALPFGVKKTEASPLQYDYKIVSQSPYPSFPATNSIVNVYIDLKNTGSENWYRDGKYKVRLGSGSVFGDPTQQHDYISEFVNEGWLSLNRPSTIVNADIVKPGETARFQFDIKTPSTPGTYKAYFTPVADGKIWMKDIGIYWEIKTVSEKDLKNASTEISVTSTPDNTIKESGVSIAKMTKESVIEGYEQSVSKLICHDNERVSQQGSGTLIYNENQNPNLPKFYIITNRHVVEPSDGVIANCSIYLYPKNNAGNSLRFEGTRFKYFGETLDLAIVEPKVIEGNDPLCGTEKDLEMLSKSNKNIFLRDFADNRSVDSIVFGYPKNGILKITSGSVLSTEFYKNNRFIDTLAPVDHGNSGGLAIDSEGYILGIPTNKAGDISMILDLEYIVNDLGIKIL